MGKDINELNEQILKLKRKRKAVLEKRYLEIGKALVKQYDLKDTPTEDILKMIEEKTL